MISKYSTHKTWAFVLERAFSCWYCRYCHRSRNLWKDLKGTSCVALVPLKRMLLSLVLSNWRGEKAFFFLLACVTLNSLHLLFPHMLQSNLCRGKLHGAASYFKWLFCALSKWEKKSSASLYGRGCRMGFLRWWGNLSWLGGRHWLPGFVCALFFLSGVHDL